MTLTEKPDSAAVDWEEGRSRLQVSSATLRLAAGGPAKESAAHLPHYGVCCVAH